MLRTFISCVVVASLSGSVLADTLDISIAAQGAGYNAMVQDAKLRGDGGLENWNLGAASGGSNRFYAATDNGNPNGRLNTFLQRFDVSSIPAGSTINSAILTTYMANQTANNRTWVGVKLSRVQAGNNWVEFVLGGNGPHTDGSVTWNHRAANTIAWATPGATGAADIDTGASTQTFDVVGVEGSATAVVRDITAWVQGWVNTPASNAGMLWYGGDSVDSGSGNRYFHFGTKEDGAGPAGEVNAAAPTLVIDYTPIPEPVTAALLGLGAVVLTGRRMKRSMV